MKRLTRISFLLTLIIAHAILGTAQEQDKPMPDRWRGLILDQSTPDDAIRVLGQPSKDKTDNLAPSRIDAWITKKRKEKIFRLLEFKKSEGIDHAWLWFLDNKLVSILLDLKKGTVSPNALNNIYGVQFQPMVSGLDLAMSPRDYERNEGRVYPKTYPVGSPAHLMMPI
ncbi:MAG: hypothetical protein H0T92_20250 [Pyrinomonadaceae bacterium]|nr:hypothetical protein [Pyrinomonadaceae bacterium]